MEWIRKRMVGITGTLSGAASVMGSWQICHSICIALIAMLSVVGITVTGMPLAFLTRIVVPLWWIAVTMLLLMAILALKMRCVPRWLMVVNTGLIVAGTPYFPQAQPMFWGVGGAAVLAGLILLIAKWREGR